MEVFTDVTKPVEAFGLEEWKPWQELRQNWVKLSTGLGVLNSVIESVVNSVVDSVVDSGVNSVVVYLGIE